MEVKKIVLNPFLPEPLCPIALPIFSPALKAYLLSKVKRSEGSVSEETVVRTSVDQTMCDAPLVSIEVVEECRVRSQVYLQNLRDVFHSIRREMRPNS